MSCAVDLIGSALDKVKDGAGTVLGVASSGVECLAHGLSSDECGDSLAGLDLGLAASDLAELAKLAKYGDPVTLVLGLLWDDSGSAGEYYVVPNSGGHQSSSSASHSRC